MAGRAESSRFWWTERALWGWIGLAFALRAGLAAAAAVSETGLLGDEEIYLMRAQAALRMVAAWVAGGAPDPRDLEVFFQQGIWPPLQALWLAAFAWLPFDPLLAARLAACVAGALATGLVYALARLLSGRRAGGVAAGLHAGSPLFLYYGQALWSEPLYAVFALCVFGSLLGWLRAAGPARFGWTAAAGAGLAAMGLTRAAVVPFLVLVPIFLVVRGRDRRSALQALLLLAVAWIGMAPWNALLTHEAGRPTLFSSRTAVQVYAGNNPYEGRLIDYAASVRTFREGADRALHVLEAEAARSGEAIDDAARRLALAHMTAHPLRLVERSLERALLLFSHDSFLLRAFTTATIPPRPFGLVLALWLLSLGLFSVTGALAFAGLAGHALPRAERALGALLIVCVVGAPMLTVSHTRLAYPALVLALPFAGVGAVALWRGDASPRMCRAALAVGLALGLLGVALLPIHLRVSAQPSAIYSGALERLDAWMPTPTVTLDRFEVRDRAGRRLEVKALSEGIAFPGAGGQARAGERGVAVRNGQRVAFFTTLGRSPGPTGEPGLQQLPRFEVRAAPQGGPASVFVAAPVDRARWNQWVWLDENLAIRWRGGSLPLTASDGQSPAHGTSDQRD